MPPPGTTGKDDPAIANVTEDSRRVVPGSAFVAVKGDHADGKDFIADAKKAGAVVIVGEQEPGVISEKVLHVGVEDARAALGVLAHQCEGNPARNMKVIGVTGTNGKTSVACLVQCILQDAGNDTASFGTIGYRFSNEVLPAPYTTPLAEDLAALFARAHRAKQSHVVMEASSQALEQQRVAGITFDVAAFTNLTQDHLDYHGTMDAYGESKLRLFAALAEKNSCAVVNENDPFSETVRKAVNTDVVSFGTKGDCRPEKIALHADGSRFTAKTPWGTTEIQLALLGAHNMMNALCAIAVCGSLGVPLEKIANGVAAMKHVPGRFDPVDEGQDFAVIVDYAHTDDGLRNVLQAARDLCKGKVLVVFGCGGDRDRTKRPKMGLAVGALADFAILTSDNPRTEDPHRILLDAEVGLQRSEMQRNEQYTVIENREEAIFAAIDRAQPNDIVVIAGKGHEDYQIIGTERIHFDDQEVARRALKARQ
jgi:UDP-N-acetylmuramoyl-L-alanyl-D-glutamate--2,6-diaminopimelate ligase